MTQKETGSRSRCNFRSAVGFLYGILLVCTIQHFPLAKFWLNFMRTGEPNDMPMQAFEGFLFIVQVPAAVHLFRNPRFLRLTKALGPHHLLAILIAMLGLSTFWSTMPGRTFWDISVISMSIISVSYLALRSSVASFITVIFSGFQISIATTYWAVWRNWPDAIQTGSGVWQGIFGNRNTLAPIAAVGALAGLCVAISQIRCRRRYLVFVLLLVIGVLDVNVLLRTESATNLIAVVLALGGLVVLLLLRCAQSRYNLRSKTILRLLATTYMTLLTIAVTTITLFSDQVSRFFGRYSGLSGRFDFWRASWDGITAHPFRGWGWNAAWLSSVFQDSLPTIVRPFLWSHSVWLEFGLGIGLVGLLLSITWMIWSIVRSLSPSLSTADGYWLVSFPLFASVLLSMESMSWIFHWFFALLVATFLVTEELRLPIQSTLETL